MDFGAHGTVLGDPGTILGRSWDIREYKKGHCKVQAWILLIFGYAFRKIFGYILTGKNRLSIFISR